MHLQKVVDGAGDRQLEEVQAETPAAMRGDGPTGRGYRPACGRWSALTRWHVVHLQCPPPPPAGRATTPSGAPGRASCRDPSARPAASHAAHPTPARRPQGTQRRSPRRLRRQNIPLLPARARHPSRCAAPGPGRRSAYGATRDVLGTVLVLGSKVEPMTNVRLLLLPP